MYNFEVWTRTSLDNPGSEVKTEKERSNHRLRLCRKRKSQRVCPPGVSRRSDGSCHMLLRSKGRRGLTSRLDQSETVDDFDRGMKQWE